MKIVKALEPIEIAGELFSRRRVVVLQRNDGNYCFAEEYYYVSWYEGKVVAEGWSRKSPQGIYSSAETAEAEALIEFARLYRLHN